MTILLLEDDPAIAQGLEFALQRESYEVLTCRSVGEALRLIEIHSLQLALLDLRLPDGSGFTVCERLRQLSDTPIIFLTASAEEVTTVMALDMGADDYITKPFRLRELLARINSVMRRSGASPLLASGDIQVNVQLAKVYKNGQEVYMSALEYRLLLILLQHKGQVLGRGQLLRLLWDDAGNFVDDNTLSVYIRRLREKLEDDPKEPRYLHTVRGMGYRWGG